MTIALVVHQCLSSGDRRIAHAVADGLSARMPAFALPVAQAPRQLGVETGLLVVGGPDGAAPEQTGLHAWLTELSTTVPGIPAAAWDTRVGTHQAAHREEKLLRLRGFDVIGPAEHFDGELERAHEWGLRLGELVTGRVRAHA